MLCYGLADLTTQSANRIVNRELCLYLLSWAKSCSILDDKGRNQTDETSLQGIGMKEATMRAQVGGTVQTTVLILRKTLSGADCFSLEEFDVGSEAQAFKQVGLHLL